MLNYETIIGLPDFEVTKVETTARHRFHIIYKGAIHCPFCMSSRVRKKDRYLRLVKHFPFGDKLSELLITGFKFVCQMCKKYFNQQFPGILPRKRASEPFRTHVSRKHHDGISQATLSKRMKVSTATIERWYRDFLEVEVSRLKGAASPKILGIDEHFFTKAKGYATTLVDLKKHRVYDVILGRSEKSLDQALKKIPLRENTRIVVMDLSSTYRQIARVYFPRAMIVADRFHVIRLINHHFMDTWKHFDPLGRKNRGLLSLMRRHQWKLSDVQKERLYRYLDLSPGLRTIYDFKQSLCKLLTTKHQTAKQCRRLIPEFLDRIKELRQSPLESLRTLGETLFSWRSEIVRMWRFTKTNSITEGFHNKMEMISRRAYGFRNFENYRLRVRAHCG